MYGSRTTKNINRKRSPGADLDSFMTFKKVATESPGRQKMPETPNWNMASPNGFIMSPDQVSVRDMYPQTGVNQDSTESDQQPRFKSKRSKQTHGTIVRKNSTVMSKAPRGALKKCQTFFRSSQVPHEDQI